MFLIRTALLQQGDKIRGGAIEKEKIRTPINKYMTKNRQKKKKNGLAKRAVLLFLSIFNVRLLLIEAKPKKYMSRIFVFVDVTRVSIYPHCALFRYESCTPSPSSKSSLYSYTMSRFVNY